MTWARLLFVAALVALLGWATNLVCTRLVAFGEARTQSKWDAQKAVDAAESLRLQQIASAELALKFRNAERITDEQTKREALRDERIAAGSAVNKRLHATIAALNGRDVSQAGSDPRAIALAQSAATARELFGSCNQAQLDLAAEADRLRDQVAGLQQDAMFVCRATQHTNMESAP